MSQKIKIILFVFVAVFLFLSVVLKNNSYQHQSRVNFLILGLDPRDDKLEKTNTTDTIIFASLNLSDAKITLIPLPRDLWFYSLEAKINQIYPLSLSQSPQLPYIQDNFSQLIGQKIDHTLILTTQDLIDFVDLLGGVDVYLDEGFTDTKFPNPEYIKNPSLQVPIYITISFDSGWNHLDQSNVSYFVRSRKNAVTAVEGGTDIGRSQRQQILIEAIVGKLKSRTPRLAKLISLYNFFHQDIQSNLSDKDIYSLFFILQKNVFNLEIQKINIPTGENPKTDILYYPGHLFYKQWVFLPQDQDYQSLQQFIQNSLK